MAIDPTIALQVKPTDFGTNDMWNSINNTRQTSSNINMQNAELPGVQAQSAQQVRQNAGQQWLQDNASNYSKPDGSFDVTKASAGLANAGFPDYANALNAHFVNTEVAQTKDASDRFELAQKTLNGTAAVLASMPSDPGTGSDLKLNDAAKRQATYLNTAGYAPNSGMKLGDAVQQPFMARDSSGNPITDPNGNPAIDASRVKAQQMSTVPADIQEKARQVQLQDHTSTEAMNPNSSISQTTDTLAKRLGLAKAGDAPQSDWYWNQRKDFQTALGNSVPSQPYQEQVKTKALENGANETAFQAVIDSMPPGYQSNGNWRGLSNLDAFMKSVTNDPQWAGFLSTISKAQAADPSIDPKSMSGDAVLAKLQANASYYRKMKEYYASGGTPGPNSVDTTGLPSAGNPSPSMGMATKATPQSGPAQELPPVQASTFKPVQSGNYKPAGPGTPDTPQASTARTATSQDISKIVEKTGLTREQVIARLKANRVIVNGQ